MGARGIRVAIVVSRFNREATERLLAGAGEALARAGIPKKDRDVRWVPGAFEIPQAVSWIARGKRAPDAIVALGCIVRGETDHHDYLGRAVIDRLLAICVATGIPVGLGVVTARTDAQALARAGGSRGNRGADAAQAALEMLKLKRQL